LRTTSKFFKFSSNQQLQNKVQLLEEHSQSPDLNPFKNVWIPDLSRRLLMVAKRYKTYVAK
uniref:Uncharacterized protein n=1 Tax=Oreochromis aureus TaxID=47969 RepID=A0AAZ1XU31_OREAU